MELTKHNLIVQYLNNIVSKNTKVAYTKDLYDFFKFFNFLLKNPSDITSEHGVQYRDWLMTNGFSSASVNRKLASIRAFLKWSCVKGIITHNPFSNVIVPKVVTESPTEALFDEEVSKILKHNFEESFYGISHKITLVLLLHLGLRRSELCNLKVKDVVEDRNGTYIKVIGKGHKERNIPLTDYVKTQLHEYFKNYTKYTNGKVLSDTDFLIQSYPNEKNSNPIHPNTIYNLVKKYAKEVGVDRNISPHSCRATVISHLLEKEVSPRDVADFAGHTSINTTVSIYDKKRLGLKNSAAKKVSYE